MKNCASLLRRADFILGAVEKEQTHRAQGTQTSEKTQAEAAKESVPRRDALTRMDWLGLGGADFQAEMGLPNVTLVLFDANGKRVSHVRGVTLRHQLVQTFRRQLKL